MSSSSSTSDTSTLNRDGRVAVDGESIGISAEGDVSVHMVADEAFEMGIEALNEMRSLASGSVDVLADALDATQRNGAHSTEIVADTLSQALFATQEAGKTEAAQLSSQIIKIAVPVAALAFVAAKVIK